MSLGCAAEPATKFIELVFKLALLVLQFSIQYVNDPLVQIPEFIKLHLLQYSVFHSRPQATMQFIHATENLTKGKLRGGGLQKDSALRFCESICLALPPIARIRPYFYGPTHAASPNLRAR